MKLFVASRKACRIIAGSVLLFSYSSAQASDPCVGAYEHPRSETHLEQQMDFLKRSYYPNPHYLMGDAIGDFQEKMLLLPMAKEDVLREQWDKLLAHELECLNAIYPDSTGLNLKLIALQDYDDDGIPDYRINYYGEFIENDIDIDNDGIPNFLDANPWGIDASEAADSDADALADHIDWSNAELFENLLGLEKYQRALVDEFSIYMMEGNVEFTAPLAEVVYDTFNSVFYDQKNFFQEKQPLRAIVSTSGPYISEGPNDSWGEVPAGTQKMYLYGPVIEALKNPQNALIGLLLVVHETVHGIQYALDAETDGENMLRFNQHSNAPNFAKHVNELGWCVDLNKKTDPDPFYYKSFVFNETEQTQFKQLYEYKGKPIELSTIAREYDALYETKDLDYNDPDWVKLLTKYNVINAYSLSNVWEWHAEYVTVSVLDRMYKKLKRMVSKKKYNTIMNLANEQIANEYGAYDLQFADKKAMKKLAAQYPISQRKLEYLVNRYLIEPFCPDGNCT